MGKGGVAMKLKVTNNWENLYWHIDDTDVTAALSRITLQLPDGTKETFKVTWKRHSEQYYDMGRPYYAEQYNAFIKLSAHGVLLDVNLQDVTKKRKVKVLDFKVRRP
jgi:hypothetical protein